MSVLINASTSTGLVQSADTSGVIELQSNGTTALTVNTNEGIQILNCLGVGNATPSTSGAGITFPATQSASTDANTLDDYEEGTWTPTISGFSGTGITATANYTKVGRVVYCSVTLAPSSGNMTGSGMSITQPFAGTSYGTGTWMGAGSGQTGGIQAVPFGNSAALSGSLTATTIMNLGWFIFA